MVRNYYLIYIFIFLYKIWVVGFHPLLTIDWNPYSFGNGESCGGIMDNISIISFVAEYHPC